MSHEPIKRQSLAPAPPLVGDGAGGEMGIKGPMPQWRLAEIAQWLKLPIVAIEGNPHYAREALLDLIGALEWAKFSADSAFDCLKKAASDLEAQQKAAATLREEIQEGAAYCEELSRENQSLRAKLAQEGKQEARRLLQLLLAPQMPPYERIRDIARQVYDAISAAPTTQTPTALPVGGEGVQGG